MKKINYNLIRLLQDDYKLKLDNQRNSKYLNIEKSGNNRILLLYKLMIEIKIQKK
jgi:hypothetical protein